MHTGTQTTVIQYLIPNGFLASQLSLPGVLKKKKKKKTWECHTKGMWYLFNCCLATLKCSGQKAVYAVSYCNSGRNHTVPKI